MNETEISIQILARSALIGLLGAAGLPLSHREVKTAFWAALGRTELSMRQDDFQARQLACPKAAPFDWWAGGYRFSSVSFFPFVVSLLPRLIRVVSVHCLECR